MARNITRDLTKNNICIVSGMAVGIDAVAHKTCIENNGKTIAVLGSRFQLLDKSYKKTFSVSYRNFINIYRI